MSNLQFLSKLTERAVFDQTYNRMMDLGLYPLFQSAYRKGHSTETALLKVQNDMNMNRQHMTLLVILDLSAAFDTVDHKILLHRLHSSLGITGTALLSRTFPTDHNASFQEAVFLTVSSYHTVCLRAHVWDLCYLPSILASYLR